MITNESYYCEIVNDDVTIELKHVTLPILGYGKTKKTNITGCSHSDKCNLRQTDCPFFKEFNNL